MNNNYNPLKPQGYEEAKANVYKEREQLPVGGYVCRIIKARVETTKNGGEMLVIAFDIAEGEQQGFYKRDFDNQETDKKWRGVFRIFLPNPDDYGSERYTKATSGYKGFITCVEDSNEPYKFDFQEKSLANKLIGLLFGYEEWEWNGRNGMSVKPQRPRSAKAIREGKFKIPNIKTLKNNNNNTQTPSYGYNKTETEDSSAKSYNPSPEMEDLPF